MLLGLSARDKHVANLCEKVSSNTHAAAIPSRQGIGLAHPCHRLAIDFTQLVAQSLLSICHAKRFVILCRVTKTLLPRTVLSFEAPFTIPWTAQHSTQCQIVPILARLACHKQHNMKKQ
jgi:hypothetical protein